MGCTKDTPIYSKKEVQEALASLKQWQVVAGGKWLKKEYKFSNFVKTLDFVNKVGQKAEIINHHPNIEFTWGFCKIRVQTHATSALCKEDFDLVRLIDQIDY
jgi:4a-hydroxytetrahydrobiopterin dehydratase